MSRVSIFTEEGQSTGKWFDKDKAQKWKEGTWWDGRNHVSKSTGSQFYHEEIFKTKTGKWVLCSWSNYQGTTETYIEISKEEAAEWFIKNEVDHPKALNDLVGQAEV